MAKNHYNQSWIDEIVAEPTARITVHADGGIRHRTTAGKMYYTSARIEYTGDS